MNQNKKQHAVNKLYILTFLSSQETLIVVFKYFIKRNTKVFSYMNIFKKTKVHHSKLIIEKM